VDKPELLRAKTELMRFMVESPAFYKDLLDLIAKHADTYFLVKGFSVRMSTLFKLMVYPMIKKVHCDNQTRQIIEQDIRNLASKHIYDYRTFVEIIKKCAKSYGIGYCALAEMIAAGHLSSSNGGDTNVF